MSYTVLLVGGDVAHRDLLAYSLSVRLSYHITHATDSVHAMQLLASPHASTIDLILLDPSLEPDTTYAVTELRKGAAEYTPIIVLVTYGDYDTALSLLGAGAQDFLTKPVALERMSITLRNALLLRDAWRDSQWLRAGKNAPSSSPFSLIAEDGNVRRIAQLEAEAIRFAIHYYNGCMTEVAQRLGIGRSTLYRKLHDLSIPRPSAA